MDHWEPINHSRTGADLTRKVEQPAAVNGGHRLPMGYMGRILRIDLSARECICECLDPHLTKLFFGGRGLGVAFLCDHFTSLEKTGTYTNAFTEVDALGADNVIILTTSPATGTRMPTSGRVHMNYKSPLTGAYGGTNGGGNWGVSFKKCGFDVLIITGQANAPVYLVIEPERVGFFDAEAINAADSIESRRVIRRQLTAATPVLTIGPAGRQLTRFATVMSDSGKAFGRGGGGAVWGAKRLFAIAVSPGSGHKVTVADPKGFDPANQQSAMYPVKLKLDVGKFTKQEKNFGILSAMGSLGILGMVSNFHQLIHNNMRDTDHNQADIDRISGEALRYHYKQASAKSKKIKVTKSACYNCPIACKRETTIVDATGEIIASGEGPEFESTTLLGANLSIYDLPTIVEANYLANQYGLDTITLGGTIAAFIDLYLLVTNKGDQLNKREKQLLIDAGDFAREFGQPAFGKPELLLPLIHLIGQGKGLGASLALGSLRFCRLYGHGELSMSVKGMELPAYDPRASFSQALCYEMNNRGGCHLQGGYTAPHAYCAGYSEWPASRIEGTPLIAKNATLKNTILDTIGACAYGGFSLGLDEYAELINAVTGGEHNSGTLKTIARRVVTLERTFNMLCGLTQENDWLPRRFYHEAIKTLNGYITCDAEAFALMHKEYYRSMGWLETGEPGEPVLRELDLYSFLPERITNENQ